MIKGCLVSIRAKFGGCSSHRTDSRWYAMNWGYKSPHARTHVNLICNLNKSLKKQGSGEDFFLKVFSHLNSPKIIDYKLFQIFKNQFSIVLNRKTRFGVINHPTLALTG
jgi:hypothetical protein